MYGDDFLGDTVTCDHEYPELCQLLNMHIFGKRLELWRTRHGYRKRWCQAAGVSMETAYQIAPWEDDHVAPATTSGLLDMPADRPCKDGKPVLPSLLQRAVNFGKATVAHLADGRRKLPESESAARLEICQGCELFIPEKFACADKRCGCNLRVKATWASEQCPRGKWPEVVSADAPTSPE